MTQHEHIKPLIDIGAITITLGSLVDLLPAIAALISIVWGLIRIWETKTVRRWMGRE